mgnify:CR=1 FL=1
MIDRGVDGTVIGPNVRRRREALGLSRAELARRARVSASWLAELESGAGIRVTADQCYRLAAALGCRMEGLMGLPELAEVAGG